MQIGLIATLPYAAGPLPTARLSPAVAATGIAMINSPGDLGGLGGPGGPGAIPVTRHPR